MQETPSLPFLIDSHTILRLTGRWSEGGVAEVRAPTQGPRLIHLPRGPWSAMALLMLAAKDSGTHGWARSFVTIHELASQVGKKTGLGRWDPDNSVRLVFKLRKLLAESGAHEMTRQGLALGGREWSKHLIEKQRFLGYRISLPPQNLELVILEDQLGR